MMYLLVVSISSPKEKIYTRTLADLTLYEITALVNLSAKTMVKFRPFLKRPTASLAARVARRAARSYPRRRDGGEAGPGMDDHRRPGPSGAPSRQPPLQRRDDPKPKGAQQAQTVSQLSVDGKSVWRFAMLRVESGTPGERVPKDYHVRRQLRPPCCFPFSPYLVRCRTKQRHRVPNLGRLHAPPLKSGHPKSPSSHDQPFPSILTN